MNAFQSEESVSVGFSLILTALGEMNRMSGFLGDLTTRACRSFRLVVVSRGPSSQLIPVLTTCRDEFTLVRLHSTGKLSLTEGIKLGRVSNS